jgi:hypothetical protein
MASLTSFLGIAGLIGISADFGEPNTLETRSLLKRGYYPGFPSARSTEKTGQ